jgi:hypothetical protein
MLRTERLARRRTIALLAVLIFIGAVGLAYAIAGRNSAGRPAVGADQTRWGPLAVVDVESGAEALSAGTVRITDACVSLEEVGNGASLLVWYDERTTWNVEEREIVLQNRDGGRVTIRDGDEFTFSGGGGSLAESGIPGDEWIADTDWVSKPDPDCPNDSHWFVNEIVPQP